MLLEALLSPIRKANEKARPVAVFSAIFEETQLAVYM
jgi:hypothetical protein